jgi:3-oxoacyl-[acyl-carrier-protein] synthase II
MSKRRVVVTGRGVVTPLATGVQATWGRLINAECGIRRITQFDVSDLPAKIAGNVLRGACPATPSPLSPIAPCATHVATTGKDEHGEFELGKWVDKRDQAHTPAFIQFALSAARQALDDARWQPTTDAEKERTVRCFSVATPLLSCSSVLRRVWRWVAASERSMRSSPRPTRYRQVYALSPWAFNQGGRPP